MVGWLSLGQLISWGSVFYGFALVMEPVERDLGLTRAQSSLAFSLAMLAEGAGAWTVGRWIDRGHERAVMTGGSVLVGLCMAAHGLVQGLVGFCAVWIGLGLAMAGTLYTPAFAVVTRRFPHDFRRAIITLTFLGGLASTAFIPLIAWLVRDFGWRHAVWAIAVLHLAVCVPLHWKVLSPHARRSVSALPPEGASPALGRSGGGRLRHAESTPLSQHLRSAPFLLVAVFALLLMGVTAALPPHMVSLLREAGLSEAWAIAVPASIGVVQVFGRLLLYFFEHRFDLHLANRLIPCLIPLGIGALLIGHGHAPAALLFVLLYGMGNGMLTIVKGTAIAQYVSREHVATLNGAMGLPNAIARAVAPLMLGVLWSRESGYSAGLWVLMAASVVAVAALIGAQRISLRNQAAAAPAPEAPSAK